MWTGLFATTILGTKPYLNIDVSHKAIPSACPLTKIYDEVCSNRRNPRQITETFENHMRRIRFVYERPGQPASKKSYKFLKLGKIPAQEKFNKDGKVTTVLAYFNDMNVSIRYPQYQCVIAGNEARSVTLPMEFCSVPAGQVKFILFVFTYSNT